jgi:uncharacterized protein YlxP (DUF503 family)
MIIAALRLTFAVPPDGRSTHGIAQKIKDKLWSRFKISVSELPSPSGAELIIGAAAVGGEEGRVKERAQQIIRFVQNSGEMELVNEEIEYVVFDDIEIERDFEKYNP